MWEEESTCSSYMTCSSYATNHDGPESARESVVDTDEEAELYSYIHHEHAAANPSEAFGSPGNANKFSSNSNSTGPTTSFLALVESQKRTLEPKESTQAQTNQTANSTSVYGNRISEVTRGKVKSWSKPESSILNWLGEVPEKNSNKFQAGREGRSARNETQSSASDTKKALPAKPGSVVKISGSCQVAESTVTVGPFNNCARLESSAVNWMRDVSCSSSKPPKSPSSNSTSSNSIKDPPSSSDANKSVKVHPPRPSAGRATAAEKTKPTEADKNSCASVNMPSTPQSRPSTVANDACKKSPILNAKPDSNDRPGNLTQNKPIQQPNIAPFITSPKVMRGSITSLEVGSFYMDAQTNDKTSKKKMRANQKVAFVMPLTDVTQRNASTKSDVEPCQLKPNLSVTFTTKEKDETAESKYSYSGKRAAKQGSPQRTVEYPNTGHGKRHTPNADKGGAAHTKSVHKKKGEKVVVNYCNSPKDATESWSTASEASCSVIPDSEVSSDKDSIHSGTQPMDLPISIAIHIGEAGRNVVIHNTASESNVQEPKIKKRKLKKDPKKSTSSRKDVHKSKSIVGLVRDSEISFEEQMRKFYDSENSDGEHENLQQRVSGNGDWSVLDVDRRADIKASNRYFVGFDPKQRLFCGNCKQRGHVMRTCPEPRRIPHCTLCGEAYHKAEVCPEVVCSRCLRRGHSMESCQVSSKYLDPPCNLCWMPGHTEDQCPDYWRRYCFTTKVGPIAEGTTCDSKTPSCYNCGSKYHWGFECPEPRMCSDIYPNYPFVVSYEPPRPPCPKGHNSSRLSAGSDIGHREREIHRLVVASNQVWQRENGGFQRSFKRQRMANKLTVEERRSIKKEAKLKKRLENAQRKLDQKAAGINTNKKRKKKQEFSSYKSACDVWVTETARRNKLAFTQQINPCWEIANRRLASASFLFQETHVNKNTLGRKRANAKRAQIRKQGQNREVHFTGPHSNSQTQSGSKQKQKRKRTKKKKIVTITL